MISLQNLPDYEKGDEALRQAWWPDRVRCPHGDAATLTRPGRDKTLSARQKYRCEGCGRSFDDRTGTVFAGHHQPLSVWMVYLYFMGLNLSNAQIARFVAVIVVGHLRCFSQCLSAFKFFIRGCVAGRRHSTPPSPHCPAPLRTTASQSDKVG